MVDCYMSLTAQYAIRLAEACRDLDIYWWEEVLSPDDVEGYREIKRAHPTLKWTTGEHEYTRYGFRQLIEQHALDILQPDVMWVGGMTELLRPSHYDAFHRITAVRPRGRTITADVVGPVCESGDFLALDRETDDVEPGDLLAVHTAGAYGYVMSSTYNARPKVAEVLVDGARWSVVTARETYEDLVRLEAPVPQWRDA